MSLSEFSAAFFGSEEDRERYRLEHRIREEAYAKLPLKKQDPYLIERFHRLYGPPPYDMETAQKIWYDGKYD